MGLLTLQVEFEQHNQQNQMVVAPVTAQAKRVVAVELPSIEVQTALANTPKPQGQTSSTPKAKRESASKTATGRKSSTKSTKQHKNEENQTQTPKPKNKIASELTIEPETAAQVSD